MIKQYNKGFYMKFFLFYFSIFLSFSNLVFSDDRIYNTKNFSTFLMKPEPKSPIIYPVELGHEFSLEKEEGDWFNVIDKKTGLKGWVVASDFSRIRPKNILIKSDYDKSFKVFKEKLMEMSKSIQDAIGMETFLDVVHIEGVAAYVIANDDWFNGRRHQNQAFQVYEIWKGQNQSPSFLSFRDSNNKEKFIVLSGPHRPRILKSNN